jgi:hypothetical protein
MFNDARLDAFWFLRSPLDETTVRCRERRRNSSKPRRPGKGTMSGEIESAIRCRNYAEELRIIAADRASAETEKYS